MIGFFDSDWKKSVKLINVVPISINWRTADGFEMKVKLIWLEPEAGKMFVLKPISPILHSRQISLLGHKEQTSRTPSYKTYFSVELYSTPKSTDQISHVTNFSFPNLLILA